MRRAAKHHSDEMLVAGMCFSAVRIELCLQRLLVFLAIRPVAGSLRSERNR